MGEENKNNKRRGFIYIGLITVLVITNIITLLLYNKEVNTVKAERVVTKEIMVERDNVQADLVALKKDYETLQVNDEKLQGEIEEKKARIDELIKEAAKHKNDAAIIRKLRKETETLREIMKGYVRTIDSLNTLNQNLVAEKKTVLKKLDEEKERHNVTIREKDELKSTVAKGSILSAFNVKAVAVYFKRGGKKEVETNRAKRTQKIKVSYSLGENKIARPGERTVFIRIMTPDGKELAKGYDDGYKFVFNKSTGYYAGKTELNYANTEISGVTMCEGSGPFVPGKYLIEVACDGVVIGNASLQLD